MQMTSMDFSETIQSIYSRSFHDFLVRDAIFSNILFCPPQSNGLALFSFMCSRIFTEPFVSRRNRASTRNFRRVAETIKKRPNFEHYRDLGRYFLDMFGSTFYGFSVASTQVRKRTVRDFKPYFTVV